MEPDDDLMHELASGRTEALRGLIDRHGAAVLNFLYRMTRDRGAAEDLSQETFLRVFRHAGRYVPGGGFRGWLYAIARNLALNHGRDRAAERCIEATRREEGDPVERAEFERAVDDAIDRIDEPFRSALVLCTLDGLSYEEAAAACDCSVKTISSRLARARARLRELLAAHLKEERS